MTEWGKRSVKDATHVKKRPGTYFPMSWRPPGPGLRIRCAPFRSSRPSSPWSGACSLCYLWINKLFIGKRSKFVAVVDERYCIDTKAHCIWFILGLMTSTVRLFVKSVSTCVYSSYRHFSLLVARYFMNRVRWIMRNKCIFKTSAPTRSLRCNFLPTDKLTNQQTVMRVHMKVNLGIRR